jgi:hypothetical protein
MPGNRYGYTGYPFFLIPSVGFAVDGRLQKEFQNILNHRSNFRNLCVSEKLGSRLRYLRRR